MHRKRAVGFSCRLISLILLIVAVSCSATADDAVFTFREVMIPMRDGVRLQTVILTPLNQRGPLPILFRRTPYGVPDKAPGQMPAAWKELSQDGYIFVIQNLRGRFKSEGVFKLSSRIDLKDPKATNEATDAYDSIDWLVKNVPGNNGKVGMFGVSYDGLTTALALLLPHPALKAVSEQASPVDQWMNDDYHRYGALRESYAFEYSVLEQADKNKNTNFEFDTYDTYRWYLDLGPLSNINAKYLHRSLSFWNSTVDHPDYDNFWKSEAWVRQLHSATVPNLNVAGFWDQEDPWGPWQIFRHSEEHDPDHINFMVAVPGTTANGKAPRETASAWFLSEDTRQPASFAPTLKPLSSAITCTARARNPLGRRAHSRAAPTPGISMRLGHRRKRRQGISTCMPMVRFPSGRLPQPTSQRSASMCLTPRIRFRTAGCQFRQPIPAVTGEPGKWLTRALSRIVRTC